MYFTSPKSHYLRDRSGMTLIETLIVTALFTMLLVVILNFINAGIKLNGRALGSIANQRVARSALDKMNREIREAATGANNEYPLVTCGSLEITFFSDYDLDDVKERVRYFVQDQKLMRGIIEPTGSPLTYVADNEVVKTAFGDILNDSSYVLFKYYNSSYAGTGSSLGSPVSCSVVRLVEIAFKVDTVIEMQPGAFYLTSKVQLRNLKSNL